MAEETNPQREGFGEGLCKRQRGGEGSRQKELTQSKARSSIMYLGGCTQFDITGMYCICNGCREIPGQSWSLLPRSSEQLKILREQYQWILTLAAVWQMELRKMRVGHFRSYWNSPGKSWWDTDLSTGRDDGKNKKKKKFEIHVEIKQTGLKSLLSHSTRSYSGPTD